MQRCHDDERPEERDETTRAWRAVSRRRKKEAVLRLLRVAGLELVSREVGVTAATPSEWQGAVLSGGEASLATRQTDGETLESDRLKAKPGEVMIERELPHEKIAALEAGRPLARRRRRP